MFQVSLQDLGLTPETQALAQGLLFGDKTQLSPEQIQTFRMAGMSHLLAVSGLHVGIIMSLIWLLFKPLEYTVLLASTSSYLNTRVGSPKTFYVIGTTVRLAVILITGLYVYAIGAPPSALRATLMLSLCLAGWMFHRPTSVGRCLILAALLLLAWDPWLITQVGFQLSFLAVGGIVLFQPWLGDHDKPWAWRVILLSLAAQVFTVPVVAYYFHQVPFLGWLQGLLVVPLMPLFITLLILVMLTQWSWLITIVEAIRGWMELVAQSITSFERLLLGGHLYFYPTWYEALLAEIGIAAIVILFIMRKKKSY